MPGKIKVKILAGRNLPVMDRSGDTTDAYVELKFGNITYKTDVCRKSLNPQWNSEWYRFEVDDAELQDEPLQIRLMDHDTYSANDAIGKVYINLNPLLLPGVCPSVKNIWTLEAAMNSSAGSQGGSVMSGWIPVYDTMHGIRGEVNIIVKVELFLDFNKFRQSSCGVQFFYSPNVPFGYHAQVIHGFVEELIVSDDPEYKWIDKIRTPRASNEARQTLFFKLSGEVQRKIGLKALDLGGNAVIGYLQNFDLEGESGIVARGIGTAVTLIKLHDMYNIPTDNTGVEEIAYGFPSQSPAQVECIETDESMPLIPYIPSHIPVPFIPSRHAAYRSTNYAIYGNMIAKSTINVSPYNFIKPCTKAMNRLPLKFYNSTINLQRLTSSTLCLSNSLDKGPPSPTHICHAHDTNTSKEYDCNNHEKKKNYRNETHTIKKQAKSVHTDCTLPVITILKTDSDNDVSTCSHSSVQSVTLKVPCVSKTASLHSLQEPITNSLNVSMNSGSIRYSLESKTGNKILNCVSETQLDNSDISLSTMGADINTEKTLDNTACTSTPDTNRSSLTFDEKPKNIRQSCMLNLINIIDRKMMQDTNHSDELVEKRKGKQHKIHKISSDSLQNIRTLESKSTSNSLNKCSVDYCRTLSTSSFMKRVASCPKNLLLNKQTNIPLKTYLQPFRSSQCLNNCNISTSCLSSIPQSLLSKNTSTSVSTNCLSSSNHNIAVPKVVIHLKGKDSLISNVSKETNHTKTVNTNLSLLQPVITGTAVQKSCSACNLREVSGLTEITKPTNIANMTYNSCVSHPSPNLRQQDETSLSPLCPLLAVPPSVSTKASHSPVTKLQTAIPLCRRSSDSDLSITPKGNSVGSSDRSVAGFLRTSTAIVRTMNQDPLEMLEYPFITMQHYPAGFILHIGGLVSSRSVKLLERISNLEEPEGRDSWWTEIRMEVRSHARALACNVVIGYKEETSICDDVCVLNACGTAAVINLRSSTEDQDSIFLSRFPQGLIPASIDTDREKVAQKPILSKTAKNDADVSIPNQCPNGKVRHISESNEQEVFYIQPQSGCNLCHIPYSETGVPFRVNISKCAICKRAKVSDVLFTTIELPESIPITGRGCFIQATVCKTKKDLRGELNAKEISDCLPFLEYELHSLLLNKLKVKGMNAIFGLKLQVSIGERLIIGMAVGTAVFLTALPTASTPQIASGNSWHNEEQLTKIQKALAETVKKNREFYHLKPTGGTENGRGTNISDTDESDDDLPDMDLGFGAKDSYVLEVDDIEDMDRISLLMDDRPPDDFHVVNTQTIPGLEDLEIVRNLQMFTQVSRAKIPAGQVALMPSKYFARLLQTVYFKLRRMVPCALCDMQFKIALPEQDEIQLSVVGMVLGLGEPIKVSKSKRKAQFQRKDVIKNTDYNDMIFSLDEDHAENTSITDVSNNIILNSSATGAFGQKPRPCSPLGTKTQTSHRHKHVPLKERYGVDITPLSYLPGGRIDRYLGNLNYFFIRESTSIRENGGLSGFTHSFVMEVLAIVRAHVTALGGNAMVAFFMTQCVLLHSPHKNQGQCLINVGGDVVSVSYFADEKHSGLHNC